MLIILGVILLIGLVVLHEFGHFIAAKRGGVEVEEFGIGFPPRAKILTKKNGTTYTLNWLPLGGFVKLKGEHDADTEPGSFGAASLPRKIKIMLAGVVVNAVTAVVLFSLIALVGLPKVFENQFSVPSDNTVVTEEVVTGYVAPDSPAELAGLEQGDVIFEIKSDGESVVLKRAEQLRDATKSFAGQEVTVVIEREGVEQTINTTLVDEETVTASLETDNQKGYLGVVPAEYIEQRATWSAPVVGTVFAGQVVQESFKVFGQVIGDLFQGDTSTAKENVVGVVGIGHVMDKLAAQGIMSILFLVALISLSLAIMNVLPIPALDGGRLFVTLLYKLFNKPLTKEAEERIHGTGFALLMVLFVLITIVDVQRIIGS